MIAYRTTDEMLKALVEKVAREAMEKEEKRKKSLWYRIASKWL